MNRIKLAVFMACGLLFIPAQAQERSLDLHLLAGRDLKKYQSPGQ